jgi:hypothetical protein
MPAIPPPMTSGVWPTVSSDSASGFFQRDFVDGHAYQVLGFLGRQFRVVFMDPGILVADVDHFETGICSARH